NSTACPPHTYTTHIYSHSPLIIYIPSFLTASEQSYLSSLSTPFSSSRIADSTGQQHLASTRSSSSTSLPPTDSIASCIAARALSFQGLDTSPQRLEPLQLVRYGEGGKYHAHTDWFTAGQQAESDMGGNRWSSFFAYVGVSGDVAGGGTGFPMVEGRRGEEWCAWVDCDAPVEEGVVFRPIPGNAVFWVNMKKGKNGYVGDQRTLHAGLPVQRGSKLGMNIWTREWDMDDKYR
ncbi:hypothetical protein IQ07DRAFT_490113, partial [Pyrenochaeta sp. DS3sAY3a]